VHQGILLPGIQGTGERIPGVPDPVIQGHGLAGVRGTGERIPGVPDPVIQEHGLVGVRAGLYQMPSLSYCRNHENIDQKIFVKCLSVLLFSR